MELYIRTGNRFDHEYLMFLLASFSFDSNRSLDAFSPQRRLQRAFLRHFDNPVGRNNDGSMHAQRAFLLDLLHHEAGHFVVVSSLAPRAADRNDLLGAKRKLLLETFAALFAL